MDAKLIASLSNYLGSQNIWISKPELELQLYSRPDAPSAYAISETLNFFGINNIVVQLELDQIDELPDNFFAFITEGHKSSFEHVVKKGSRLKIGAKIFSKEQFLDIWSGITLLAEKNETPVTKVKKGYLIVVYTSVIVVTLFFRFQKGYKIIFFYCWALLVFGFPMKFLKIVYKKTRI